MADELHAPQGDVQTAASTIDEEPSGAIMSYLSLHLPSWGTSAIFHIAIILLCIFLVWQVRDIPQPERYTSAFIPGWNPVVKPRPSEPEKLPERDTEGSGLPEFGPEGPRLEGPESPTGPDFEGLDRAPAPPDESTTIFRDRDPTDPEVQEEAQKRVYVIDASGSMTDSMDYVKKQLKDSIGDLAPTRKFHVIFFSSGKAVEMPTRRLVPATKAYKAMACEFIGKISAAGQTDPTEAIKRAFAVRPDRIYLLTDGEFDRSIVEMIDGLNRGKNVEVYTIGFLYRSGEKVLSQIAEKNKGFYTFVSEDDLTALAR